MQKCYQIYKLVSLVRYKIITWISVCMNKKLLQNRVVNRTGNTGERESTSKRL